MSAPVTLSYVLTTFNKLPYLKVTLPCLLEACTEDEEIVIVDGGSTDGTVEFLSGLANEKKIHQFVSGKDFGEAHGTNKAILMAKGALIKIITDDDAYSYRGIRRCRDFMMNNAEIDLMGSDGCSIDFIKSSDNSFIFKNATPHFLQWRDDKTPFIITGLSLMMRKSSIPLLGLFDVNFMIIDFEYSLRITSGRARLGWYSGCTFVNIVNQNSNSGRHWQRLNEEKARLDSFYGRKEFYLRNHYLRFRATIGNFLKGEKTDSRQARMNLNYPEVFERALAEIRVREDEGEFYC
jgi:glycosyltransferase involved in cell wall biosynthesis